MASISSRITRFECQILQAVTHMDKYIERRRISTRLAWFKRDEEMSRS